MPRLLLQHYLERSVKCYPDRQAATDGTCSLSYRDLDLRANRLARSLSLRGVGRGQHVVLAMSRSVRFIEAVMGVLKADAVYVPTMADAPRQRRRAILEDCRPQALIGDRNSITKVIAEDSHDWLPPLLVCLESGVGALEAHGKPVLMASDIEAANPGPLTFANRESDTACIHYTSGSTGMPKGVVITHRNIDEYIGWAVERLEICEQDRILGTAPFHFDMSLFDVYCSLRAGASLCIATEKKMLFPRLLVEFAESESVTIWKGVSSLLMYLARTGVLSKERLATLKKVLFSGEVLPTKYLIQWMEIFPGKTYYNAYGPTEATGISMYFQVKEKPSSPDERIPLGIPCENTEVFLLDEHYQPIPPGEPGELYIKGVCVTKGYLNDVEKTRNVFLDNPLNPGQGETVYRTGDFARLRPDGNYEFLGRKDNQVKYMGYRLELTDIEQSLVSVPGVRDAAVLLVRSETTDLDELVAYLEIDTQTNLPSIARDLKAKLPLYMIPKQFNSISHILRSEGGKIDRSSLLAHHRAAIRRA